jgi:hypothetical protein
MPEASPPIWGVVGQFETPETLREAARRVREAGYQHFEAYTPFDVPDVRAAMGLKRSWLPAVVLVAGIGGAAGGFGMQWFSAVYHHPINVGGRPFFSWPAFIPITFELGGLLASATAVLAVFAFARLPMPYHPVFNTPGFDRASQDRFFLAIEQRDEKFDLESARRLLTEAGALEVSIVEA